MLSSLQIYPPTFHDPASLWKFSYNRQLSAGSNRGGYVTICNGHFLVRGQSGGGKVKRHICINACNRLRSSHHCERVRSADVLLSISEKVPFISLQIERTHFRHRHRNLNTSSIFAGMDRGVRMAIDVRDVSVFVGKDSMKIPILKNCSMQVPEGQLWMLLGPNGSGKSTFLKTLAGLLRPSHGHIYIAEPRSFVFQNPDHQVVMPTAEADVAFGLGRFDLSEDEVRQRVDKSLEAVGIAEYRQRSVQTLSGGQKQRVAIAGALAEASRVLLLDELTTFLDEKDQIGVIEAVKNIVGGLQAVTALWVTHRLEELEYADGATYMEDGTVVLSGMVNDVKEYIQRRQDEYRNVTGRISQQSYPL
eukprot:c26004_g1_i1 orf=239-1324(-)